MIEWLKLPEATRKASIEQAAFKQGIRAKAVEKDWWVTLTLKALFTSKHKDYLIFKGGTSLSKGWRLIQRFSEDIDVALSNEALGIPYEESPSKKYLSKLKRAGCEFTSNELKAELEAQFKLLGVENNILKIEAAEVPADRPDTDPQKIFIHYKPIIEPEEYIKDIVMVEVSVRSLKEPATKINIQSLLNESFPEIHKEVPFEVTVVEPHRTFLEKIFLLHEEFQNINETNLKGERRSRHLYDLVQMMDKEPGKKALADQDLYQTIIKYRSVYNKIKDVDYSTHATDRVSFIPPANIIEAYHNDYDKMKEVMIYGDVPEFIHLLKGLSELLRRFRGLAQQEELKKSYEPIAGNYIRWWEDDKQKGNGRIFARANMKYETDIKYTINVSTLIYYGDDAKRGTDYTQDQIETWTGELFMESSTTGTIIWNQENPKSGAKGYKKIVIDKDENKITLIGEKSKGFGHEVFTERE